MSRVLLPPGASCINRRAPFSPRGSAPHFTAFSLSYSRDVARTTCNRAEVAKLVEYREEAPMHLVYKYKLGHGSRGQMIHSDIMYGTSWVNDYRIWTSSRKSNHGVPSARSSKTTFVNTKPRFNRKFWLIQNIRGASGIVNTLAWSFRLSPCLKHFYHPQPALSRNEDEN